MSALRADLPDGPGWGRVSVLALALLVFTVATAGAQITTGGIRGIVKDETGAVLIGVTVEAQSPSRIGPPAVSVTNDQGWYRFEEFPAGMYTVSFTLQGFTNVRRENIRVEVGRSTQLDMTLSLSATQESVTVTGESPVTDTVHADYGTNFNQELLENVPNTRNSYYDIIRAVPGIEGGATFTYFGSNSDQNSYQINGVDVSAPDYGRAWAWPNPDIIKEIEVLGVGASAEYSGFQGGVVSVVTKSGSNSWRGVGTAFLMGSGMVGNNTPDEEFPPKIDYNVDVTGEIGGPIVKDRLWAIVLLQSWNRRQVPVGVELTPEVKALHEFRSFYKADAQLSTNDNLSVHFDDNNFKSADPPTRLQPVEATSTEHGHNPVFSARWTHTMGSNSLLEVKGGGLYIRDRLDPTLENFVDAQHSDLATGELSVNSFGTWHSVQNKTQFGAALTHYTDQFVKGSHDFKFGMQATLATAKTYQAYFQNAIFYDYAAEPYYIYTREPYAIGGTINTVGAFASDNWTLNDRLTLNLGVRFDHTSGSIPAIDQLDQQVENPTGVRFDGIPDLIAFNNTSPRLGFSYRLDKDGKTVFKASYGRYYGKLISNMFDALSRGNTRVEAILYNPDTGQYDIPFYSVDFNSNFDVNRDLKNQYTDQFMVGIEREIRSDFGLKALFLYKTEDDFIRVDDVRGVYEQTTFEDTFEGQAQTLSVFNRISPDSQSLYQVTNRTDLDQRYKSFVLQANKRWSDGWQLDASYQWQRGLGNSGGQVGRFPGTLQNAGALNQRSFGSDPNDLINSFGRLPSDSTYKTKITGSYEAPWGIHLGARFDFETGRPYGRFVNVRGLDQGVRSVLAQPSGAYELDTLYDVQVRIDKDFNMGGERRLRLSLDIFNLLNGATATRVQNNSSQGNFGRPTQVVFPRQAMIGIRYEF